MVKLLALSYLETPSFSGHTQTHDEASDSISLDWETDRDTARDDE